MTVQAWSWKEANGIADNRGRPQLETEIVKRPPYDARKERRDNLHALFKAKAEDREALMGKLMKEQAPKSRERKNPYVIDGELTPFQQACLSQLTDKPQSASQVAHRLNGAASNVGATLTALATAGRAQRQRITVGTKGNTYWVFWK